MIQTPLKTDLPCIYKSNYGTHQRDDVVIHSRIGDEGVVRVCQVIEGVKSVVVDALDL